MLPASISSKYYNHANNEDLLNRLSNFKVSILSLLEAGS